MPSPGPTRPGLLLWVQGPEVSPRLYFTEKMLYSIGSMFVKREACP